MNGYGQEPECPGTPAHLPEDIQLDEAGRNWVSRQSAADPALTAAIGQVYGGD